MYLLKWRSPSTVARLVALGIVDAINAVTIRSLAHVRKEGLK